MLITLKQIDIKAHLFYPLRPLLMKTIIIETIKLHQVEIPFSLSIAHNLKERKQTQSLVIEIITSENKRGYGEAAPRMYVTGESIAGLIHIFNSKLKDVTFPTFKNSKDIREWIYQWSKTIHQAPSLFAALEIALLDLLGQYNDCSIDHFYSNDNSNDLIYSGIVPYLPKEKFIDVLKMIHSLQLPHVKIKVGNEHDLENLKIAREILGDTIDIRVDANRSWTLLEAIDKIHSFEQFNISAVEEPLRKNYALYLPELVNNINTPLILDESVCSLEEARYYADRLNPESIIFNIKISKVGGLNKASELFHFAKDRNIACQLGCHVGETAILTAAGRLFAQSHKVKYLEGAYTSFFMADDIIENPLSFGKGGKAPLIDLPGLGITVDTEKLQSYSTSIHQIKKKCTSTNWKKVNDTFNELGVAFNKISTERLFDEYEKIGFLYPAKQRLLAPYFEKINSNWKKLKASKNNLLWILNKEDKDQGNFSSISVIKYYNRGLIAQHLVSSGNPILSLEIMQAAQRVTKECFEKDQINSSQNWFRPNNRYAYRIFASVYKELGSSKASLSKFHYLHLPLHTINPSSNQRLKIEELSTVDENLNKFLVQQKGEAFVIGEELNITDLQQKKIAMEYQKENLKRSRVVLKITQSTNNSKVLGAVIINRAPLGINFSFLGNRCMILLDEQLNESSKETILLEVLSTIKNYYADFELGKIPIITDANTSIVLQKNNAEFLREYMQCIWLRAGFEQWEQHIDSFLSALLARKRKQLQTT